MSIPFKYTWKYFDVRRLQQRREYDHVTLHWRSKELYPKDKSLVESRALDIKKGGGGGGGEKDLPGKFWSRRRI